MNTPLRPICGTHYNAPFVPGGKLTHIWLCERPQGHAGPHASPSHSISLTMASRRFTLDAVVASLPPIEDDDEECQHKHVERDDDGISRTFWVCTDCDREVYPVRDEDGGGYWEVLE